MPSFPWKLETSKSRKKPKKSQYSEFAQKRSQKCPNVFWTCLGQFFWKLLAQLSMEGRVFENFQKKPKIFKVPKKPKIVTKSVQTCFELVLGQIFPKTFFPSVPWKLETSKSRKKPKKKSQYSDFVLNRSQKCPNVFWMCFEVIFSKKKFLTSVPRRLETSKFWKK